MTFVANPAASPAPPAVADEVTIGDAFWPSLSIAAFRAAQRIPDTVHALRARDALLGGFLSAEAELLRWRAAQESEGKETLAATSPLLLNGEARAIVLWKRAVHAFAAADLAETHSDIAATEAGRDRIEIRATAADDLRRTGIAALRDLMGKTRTKVALV